MFRFFYLIIVLSFGFHTIHASEVITLAEAKALSEKINKPILFDFMTEW
jgi:hypothetical protein